jgi:hypothetical protein
MKTVRILIVGLACVLSACVMLPKVSSEQYGSAIVVLLVSDTIDTSRAASYFGIPKGGTLTIEGLSKRVETSTQNVFESNGYDTTIIRLEPREFWEIARNEVKPTALDFIAKSEGVGEGLKRLVSLERVSIKGADVVFVVGANESYANENRLSARGQLFEVNTLATSPGISSTLVTPASSAFKAPELTGIRNSRGLDVGAVPVLGFGSDISSINEDDRQRLLEALCSSYERALDIMLKRYN